MKIPDESRLQFGFITWLVVLLFSGQAFRNIIGLWGYAALCTTTLIVAVWLLKRFWEWKRVPVLLACFVALSGLTTLWSAYKLETLIGFLALASTTVAGLLVAFSLPWDEFLKTLWLGLFISVAGSVIFELYVALVIQGPVMPVFNEIAETQLDIEDPSLLYWSTGSLLTGGPIQGLMGNRNLLGFAALLLMVCSTVLLLNQKQQKDTRWVVSSSISLALGFIVHLLTVSATITLGVFASIAVLVVAFILRRTPERWKRPTAFIIALIVTAVGILGLKYFEVVFTLLDRDPNLTNRTLIWERVSGFALQRPEGWGWVGYWPLWKYPFNEISDGNMMFAHAHNAFIDVWLQTGVVGVALLAVMFGWLLVTGWRLLEHSHKNSTYFPVFMFLLTCCLFLQSITESRLLLEGNWFVFTVLIVYTPMIFKKTSVKKLKADIITHEYRK